MQCRSCGYGFTYYCSDCDTHVHNGGEAHARDELNEIETCTGNKPRNPSTSIFKVKYCTACNVCLNSNNSSEVSELVYGRKIFTLSAGSFSAIVVPLKCVECKHVSGLTAVEYCCVPGSSSIWFEMKLIETALAFQIGSKFSLSQHSLSKSLSYLNSQRGCNELTRSERDAMIRAIRYLLTVEGFYLILVFLLLSSHLQIT
jgi:hypothetical protein